MFFLFFLSFLININYVICKSPMGIQFTNWDGQMTCNPKSYMLPSTESQIIELIKSAYKHNETIKVIGAGMSFSGIQLTTTSTGATDTTTEYKKGHMLSLQNYNKILNVDYIGSNANANTDIAYVTVEAGIELRHLSELLDKEYHVALINMGATATQSVVGAFSTGTHGTGTTTGNIASTIVGLTIINSRGEVYSASETQNKELFDAARVGLGAVGIISTVTLSVIPQFKLERRIVPYSLTYVLDNIDTMLMQTDRLQWSFTPYTDDASVIFRTQVALSTPIYPSGPDGGCWSETQSTSEKCIDISYKAMTDSELHYQDRTLYTEMEMFIRREDTMSALADYMVYMESIKEQHNPNVTVSIMLRYLIGDDITMSPVGWGANVPSSVISIIAIDSPEEFHLFSSGLESICQEKYNGRAHWGKVNTLDSKGVNHVYGEKVLEFNNIMSNMDPTGVFMNEYIETRFN